MPTADFHPFLPVTSQLRAVIIVYFVLWRLLPAVGMSFGAQSWNQGSAIFANMLVNVITEFLILLPFLVSRFAGMSVGLLHPLIAPTLISIAFGLIRDPVV